MDNPREQPEDNLRNHKHFIIGMIRKPVPTKIITSLIVIVLRQEIIMQNPTNQETLLQLLIVAVITFALSLLIFRKKVAQLY